MDDIVYWIWRRYVLIVQSKWCNYVHKHLSACLHICMHSYMSTYPHIGTQTHAQRYTSAHAQTHTRISWNLGSVGQVATTLSIELSFYSAKGSWAYFKSKEFTIDHAPGESMINKQRPTLKFGLGASLLLCSVWFLCIIGGSLSEPHTW